MHLYDIFLLRTSAVLPKAISDGDRLPPLILICFSPLTEVGITSHLICHSQYTRSVPAFVLKYNIFLSLRSQSLTQNLLCRQQSIPSVFFIIYFLCHLPQVPCFLVLLSIYISCFYIFFHIFANFISLLSFYFHMKCIFFFIFLFIFYGFML